MLSGLDELVWEFGNYWRTYLTDYIYNDTDIMNTAELCEFLRDLGRQKGNLTCDIVCLQFSGSAKEERKAQALNGHTGLTSNLCISATVAKSKGKWSRLSEKKRKKNQRILQLSLKKDCLTAITAT